MTSIHTLASVMATDMNYYAGDPGILNAERYTNRMKTILESNRSDQLTARVAIHVQLREAFQNADVQSKLTPFLDEGESFGKYVQEAKSRAQFFAKKQQALQHAILRSDEQQQLKEAHHGLANWEKENAVLLRHQMFMTYMPSQALLLESAATVALYRQYTALEEGQYTSESSDGEVPQMLRRMGGKNYFTQSEKPFHVDEHTKMFSQEVLENKRVEYEQLREKVADLRSKLERSPTVKRLEEFLHIRHDIYHTYGIDRLVSLCARKDKELGEPNEGGIERSIATLPSQDEFVTACRTAQYSLPKMVEACYSNYRNIIAIEDGKAVRPSSTTDAGAIVEHLQPLQTKEVFRHWFLASITADCPQLGPNQLIGKNKATTTLEDFKKFFYPQKSSYVPSLNSAHRQTFALKVAERRGLPHLVVLSPAKYSYRENNDPKDVSHGILDLMVYDMTNEKVLLMICDSSDSRRPRGAFLNAQEERYRFAAVVRSAITYENQYHGFECSGTIAEYFFDPKDGPEENYYCIMAPSRLSAKCATQVKVPISAFRPFATCPPRYFVLGSNWGVSAGTNYNPYTASYAHMQLNEDAIALSSAIPDGFVSQNILPHLPTREEGMKLLAELRKKEQPRSPQGALRGGTPHSSLPSMSLHSLPRSPHTATSTAADILALEEKCGPAEEPDPLSLVVGPEVLHPLRDVLLQSESRWATPSYLQARAHQKDLRSLPAVVDGNFRTPLNVFDDYMKEKFSQDPVAASPLGSARTVGNAKPQ